MDGHRRRSIRLPGYDYSQEGGYFVTLCASGRACLFGGIIAGEMQLNTIGQMAEKEWKRLERRFPHIELDEFVVMPNHVHGIIFIMGRGAADTGSDDSSAILRRAPTREQFGHPVEGSIPTIIRSYKAAVAYRYNRINGCSGNPVWQRNYYEHVLRNERDLDAVRRYIRNNPLQWHLDRENPAFGRRK